MELNNMVKKGKCIDVSIIIVTYNSMKMTLDCIESVIEKTKGISYEILLVDNASSDGSREFFSYDKRVTYLYNEENIGFGRANNEGLKLANGRNILFLNSDMLLRNNAVKIMSDYLDEHKKASACGANLFNAEGNPTHSFYRYLPSIYSELNILSRNRLDKIRFGKNLQFNFSNHPINIAHITGADLMTRKDLLDSIGGFNPAFFMYYEDTELCFRLAKRGKLVSLPDAEITHFQGVSTAKCQNREIFVQNCGKSQEIFYSIVYPKWYILILKKIRKVNGWM